MSIMNNLSVKNFKMCFITLWSFLLMGSTYEITGSLVDQETSPVVDHIVMLYDNNHNRLAIDTTDSQGSFILLYQELPVYSDRNSQEISGYNLGSSYPNPFNPRTTIPFESPANIEASLVLYNILGQEIIRKNTNILKGHNKIEINLGGSLSQGHYLLRVQAADFIATETLTFVSAGISSGYTGIRVTPGESIPSANISRKKTPYTKSEENLRLVIATTDIYLGKEISVPFNENFHTGLLTLNDNEGTVKDIDGNEYQTVVIENQLWMAENLRTKHYRNGDPIPNVPDTTEWNGLNNPETGAWVYYNNDSTNVDPYGKLYNWYAAMDERGLCPLGWRVPSDYDWKIMEIYLGVPELYADSTGWRGVRDNAGGQLKAAGTEYWLPPNDGATNESGFSGLPGGNRYVDGSFGNIREFGYWWTATESADLPHGSFRRRLKYDNNGIYRNDPNRRNGYSVRCIKK